jgi:hypothetical protein
MSDREAIETLGTEEHDHERELEKSNDARGTSLLRRCCRVGQPGG